MTIASQLTLLNSTKTAIKTAIENKGATVGTVPFADYPAIIDSITGGGGDPGPQPTPWNRPTDWLEMPTPATDEQVIYILNAVFDTMSNYAAIRITGAYTIDWGDGVIEDVASGIVAQHIYNYADIDPLTLTERGYRQAMIKITPQAGQNLTRVEGAIHSQRPGTLAATFLDMLISVDNTQFGTFSLSALAGIYTMPWVERVKFIASGPINFGLNNGSLQLGGMYSLRVLEWPEGSFLTTTSGSIFQDCRNLEILPKIIIKAGLGFFSASFQGCNSLLEVDIEVDISTPNLAWSQASCFNGCSSLQRISITNIGADFKLSGLGFMFTGCNSLKEIPQNLNDLLNLTGTSSALNAFQNCYRLTSIPYINFSNITSTSASNMFQNCINIQGIPEIDFSKFTSTASMFAGCNSLKTLPEINMPLCTTAAGMFAECNSLRNAPVITTSNSLLIATTMFQNCYSMESVELFNTSKCTNLQSMFNNCSNLARVPAFVFSGITNTSQTTIFGSGALGSSSCLSLNRSQVTGMPQSHSYRRTNMSAAALNEIFTNLPTVSARTITITETPGAATCDRTIATAKGWTVTG